MAQATSTLEELLAAHGGGPLGSSASLPPVGLELLDGVPHRTDLPSTRTLAIALALATAFDAHALPLVVDVRGAILAPPDDLLRPELVLRRHVPVHMRRPAPSAGSVVLAVLVGSDEPLLQRRAARCGAAGIPETWCLPDAPGSLGVRYLAPRGGRYALREPIFPGERLAPVLAPWLEVEPLPAAERNVGPAAPPAAAAVPQVVGVRGALTPRPARSRTSRRRAR